VAARIFTLADAAAMIADFPERAMEQRSWLLRHHSMATAAMDQVLDDHRAAVASGMVPMEGTPNSKRHIADIHELIKKYGSR
jgi:hypothetical protein